CGPGSRLRASQAGESCVEPPLPEESSSDVGHALGEEWRGWDVACDLSRFAKVVQVVTLRAADGEHDRVGLLAASGSAHSLLVVESLRRHVCLKDCLKWSDVDAHFHGGGHREKIDLFAFG